jgi:hypothetical protein
MVIDTYKIDNILSKLALIPKQYRCFSVDSEIAERHYGIQTILLAKLISCDLPLQKCGATTYFDPFDLANISLHLSLPSVQRFAMRTWSRTLQQADTIQQLEAEITIQPLLEGTRSKVPINTIRVMLEDGHLSTPDHIRHLLKEFSAFQFYMLPERCRWNMSFISQNKICECGGASKLLLHQARERGIDARQCFGLLIAEPYSTGHYWVEFHLNGKWIPFDPLLISLLHTTTKLPPDKWPIYRSTNIALHRLCIIDGYAHDGAPKLGPYTDEPYVTNPIVIMENQTMIVTLPTQISKCEYNAASSILGRAPHTASSQN